MIRYSMLSLFLLSYLGTISTTRANDINPLIKNMPSDAISISNKQACGYVKTFILENNSLKYWNYVYDANKNYIGIVIRGFSLDNQEPVLLLAYRDIETTPCNQHLVYIVVEKTKHQENL